MADRISLPPTPPGLQDQMYRGGGGPQPMPTPPRQANTLVVGGPAYFTPEGYQAPIQPTQSFMPTNRAPDPIRDQFNRQLPPIQRPQPPMPAPQPQTPAPTPAPVQAPAPTQTGGVPEPEPYVPPVPAPQEDSPNFLAFQQTPGYQDFINSGSMGTMDMYTASDGREFGSGTVGRMYDDYLASLGQADSNTSAPAPAPAPAPEPVFTPPPTTPEPNGFFPGVTPDFSNLDFSGLSDLNLEDMDFSNLPVPPPPPPPRIPVIEDMDFTNMPDFSNVPGIQNIDFSGLPQYQMPAPTMTAPVQTQGIPIGEMPVPPEVLARKKRQEEEREAESIRNAIAKYGSVENQQKSIREALSSPAPIYTPPPQIEEMFDDYDFGNPNLRNMRGFDPRR